MNNTENQDSEFSQSAAYQVLIIVLTIYSVFIFLFIYILPIGQLARRPLMLIDFLISLVFLFDFFRALRQSPSRSAYLRWGWLDLLGSLPGLPFLRPARIPRAVWLAKNLRRKRLSGAVQELGQDRAATAVMLILLIALLSLSIFSGLVLVFEGQAPNANIRSPDDALWWTLVTISTVGYGDFYPVTAPGRFLAMILITFGISIFGVISSALASWFLRPLNRREEFRRDREAQILREEIVALRSELQALKQMLPGEKRVDAEDQVE